MLQLFMLVNSKIHESIIGSIGSIGSIVTIESTLEFIWPDKQSNDTDHK